MIEQFKLSSASALLPDLNGKSLARRKQALRTVIANMTVNNLEMLSLFPSIISCISSNDTEIKRMCFLYIETYAKARPSLAKEALSSLVVEFRHPSPAVRAMACRTLSSVQAPEYVQECIAAAPKLLSDSDPQVRKSASYAVAKLWVHDQAAVEAAGLLRLLNRLLADTIPMVVSSAVQALMEITSHTYNMELVIDFSTALALAAMLPQCTEWAQSTNLSALTYFVPNSSEEATQVAKLVRPRLQHINSSVVLGTVKVLLYLKNYGAPVDLKDLTEPLISQLSRQPEIAYVVLRSLMTILSAHHIPLDPRTFIYQEGDPIFIKTAKLDNLVLLASPKNSQLVLRELFEFTRARGEVGHRAVSALGKVGIRVSSAAPQVLDQVLWLLKSSNDELVQGAVAVVRDMARRYPSMAFDEQLEAISRVYQLITQNKEAYSALLWLVGHFPGKMGCSLDALREFSENFDKLPLEVQLPGLTSSVKVFLLNPNAAKEITPELLRKVSETAENPDLRDRAIMYWRLLAQNAQETLSVISAPLRPIDPNTGMLDDELLEELELDLGYLSSIYLKPAQRVFRLEKARSLKNSPALIPRDRSNRILGNPESDGETKPLARREPPPKPPSRPLQRMDSLMGDHRPRNQSTIQLNSISESAAPDENARLIDI